MKKNVLIWTSEISDEEACEIWKGFCEANFEDSGPEYDPYNSDMARVVYELNRYRLDDERMMVKEIPDPENGIIAIATLGLWNGTHYGYNDQLDSVSECLTYRGDDADMYIDRNNDLIVDERHHDGSNRILYRAWKDNISETQKGNFIDKLLDGELTRRDVSRYTRNLGSDIKKLYGID